MTGIGEWIGSVDAFRRAVRIRSHREIQRATIMAHPRSQAANAIVASGKTAVAGSKLGGIGEKDCENCRAALAIGDAAAAGVVCHSNRPPRPTSHENGTTNLIDPASQIQ